MKNAIILHGTGTKADEFWYPWLKSELEKKNYDVWLPQLPNDDFPNLKEWLPFVLENGTFTEETIIIGHSAGSQLILSILENLNIQITLFDWLICVRLAARQAVPIGRSGSTSCSWCS